VKRQPVSVDEGYAHWASHYDSYPNALIAIEEPLVRGLVGDVRGKRVLDVACGTGRHSQWLAEEEGAYVTGLDRSEAMLAIARGKSERVRWMQGDLDRIPFDDASFDVVVCGLVFEHVKDIEPAIIEAARVLVPGGRYVVSVFHPAFLWKGVVPHFVSRENPELEYEMPAYVHLPSEYVAGLRKAGFELGHFSEPVVDDAGCARFPNMSKHRGLPLAIVLEGKLVSSRA
jgi:ubiquinone/menaquinone biosynthesis C-methylase UbiE